jgi:AcrR family transcriptional regulator
VYAEAVKGDERRQQLLQVAKRVFAQKGYHSATVDDIVASAGVARGTFYLYFRDKRAALVELVDVAFAQLGMAILTVEPESVSVTVADQVRQNLRAIFTVLLDDRAMTKIFLADAVGLDPEFDQKLLGFYSGVQAMLLQALIDGQRLGIVMPGDPQVYAVLTLGALKEPLYQIIMRGLPWDEPMLTEAAFTFLRGGVLRV